MLGLSSSKIKLHSVVNIHLLKDSSVLGQKVVAIFSSQSDRHVIVTCRI